MFTIVGFAYVLAVLQGSRILKERRIKKQYYAKNDKTYYRSAIFTLGYEFLEANIFNIDDLLQLIGQLDNLKPIFNYEIFLDAIIKEYSKYKSVQ